MATTSFDQKFIVADKESAEKLRDELKSTPQASVPEKDMDKDRDEAIRLLLSTSQN